MRSRVIIPPAFSYFPSDEPTLIGPLLPIRIPAKRCGVTIERFRRRHPPLRSVVVDVDTVVVDVEGL